MVFYLNLSMPYPRALKYNMEIVFKLDELAQNMYLFSLL